jgi:hypothetical protein
MFIKSVVYPNKPAGMLPQSFIYPTESIGVVLERGIFMIWPAKPVMAFSRSAIPFLVACASLFMCFDTTVVGVGEQGSASIHIASTEMSRHLDQLERPLKPEKMWDSELRLRNKDEGEEAAELTTDTPRRSTPSSGLETTAP